MKEIYFVTGNEKKVELFNDYLAPEYKVISVNSKETIEELKSTDVSVVVMDKLEKSFELFSGKNNFLFVTDVGLSISDLNGFPGGLIKRETKRLFEGDFKRWCQYLKSEDRSSKFEMIIGARNKNNIFFIKHEVKGYISKAPLPGNYGFDWDEIFVPESNLVDKRYEGLSFAQLQPNIKNDLIMGPAIKKFKKQLDFVLS